MNIDHPESKTWNSFAVNDGGPAIIEPAGAELPEDHYGAAVPAKAGPVEAKPVSKWVWVGTVATLNLVAVVWLGVQFGQAEYRMGREVAAAEARAKDLQVQLHESEVQNAELQALVQQLKFQLENPQRVRANDRHRGRRVEPPLIAARLTPHRFHR